MPAASSASSAPESQSQLSRVKFRDNIRPDKADEVSKRNGRGVRQADKSRRQQEDGSSSWPDEEEAELEQNAIKSVATPSELSEAEVASEIGDHDNDHHNPLTTSLPNHRHSLTHEPMAAPLETVQQLLRDNIEEQSPDVNESQPAIRRQHRMLPRQWQALDRYEAGELTTAPQGQYQQAGDYAAGEPDMAHRHLQQDIAHVYYQHGDELELSDSASDGMDICDEVDNELPLPSSNVIDMFGTTADDVQRRLWRRRQR